MKNTFVFFCIIFLIFSATGCGKKPLAQVGVRDISEEEFRESFSNLPVNVQNNVLEPGGRYSLIERLIEKKLLEIAVEEEGIEDDESTIWWQSLYRNAELASTWAYHILDEKDSFVSLIDTAAVMDTLSKQFELVITLAPDSITGEELAEDWKNGHIYSLDIELPAAWVTKESRIGKFDGSRYSMPEFVWNGISDIDTDGVYVVPVLDVWAVIQITFVETELDSVIPMGLTDQMFRNYKRSLLEIELNHRSIGLMAEHMREEEGRYIFEDLESIDPNMVLCSHYSGEVQAGEIIRIFENVRDENFFGSVASEIVMFRPPVPGERYVSTDLLLFVNRMGQAGARAARTIEANLETDAEKNMKIAVVEELLRRHVLQPVANPDEEQILQYYAQNMEQFSIPEKRRILFAPVHVDSMYMLDEEITGFDQLDAFIYKNEEGNPEPSPFYTNGSFGLLGDTVFASEVGIFTGPVEVQEWEMVAFFEVVEIQEATYSEPEDVWAELVPKTRDYLANSGLIEYLGELREEYGVEIDSAAVESVVLSDLIETGDLPVSLTDSALVISEDSVEVVPEDGVVEVIDNETVVNDSLELE